MSSDFKILKTTPLPDSETEIEGEISVEALERHRKEAIKHLNSRIKIDGFREGHIPEKVLIDKVGELGVLEEMASHALESSYMDIIRESKVNPVGRPQVSITKLAAGNPLGFKINIAVVPEIKLPDYKKISGETMSKKEEVEVTEKEIEEAISQIQKSRVPVSEEKKETAPLPELTNDFVKTLGDFKDVEDFKTKLRDGMKQEKEMRNREKRRLETMEKVIADTKMELPKILIESEQEKMLDQFKGNIASMGLKPEDYFKQIGKTEDEVKSEWKPEAEKRAKMELILQKIALEEKLEPAKEDVEKEITHILSHHKDADPMRARIYVEQILTNEKVWQFLEGQK